VGAMVVPALGVGTVAGAAGLVYGFVAADLQTRDQRVTDKQPPMNLSDTNAP
jgi:hypothetical protein